MPASPDTYVARNYGQTLGARKTIAHRGKKAIRGDQHGCLPTKLDLKYLARPSDNANPMGEDFDYATAFQSVDLDELGRDVDEMLTRSQEFWPADHGHYGPLLLRMAWHAAGTYRMGDGRGGASAGMQRFAPLNSWPDNVNLDKARRLLWPVKQKYGAALSWADLMVFAGTRALESMGLETFGFAGGREDVWVADEIYWGPEHTWLADERHCGVRDLDEPLAASVMGLIYVDPQGPSTTPDPRASARDIRQTFARMGMNDEETVALIAGGHTFGKTHGAAEPGAHHGPEPEDAPLEAQGIGWASSYGTGKAEDTISSGLDGTWTPTPTKWDNSFLETMFAYEWDVALSPCGMWQWIPRGGEGKGTVPDAHDPSKTHVPTMLTTDLALQEDPAYREIALRFLEHPDQLADAFARSWFKLTHLDMGPAERYLGSLVPAERLIWQDPVPPARHDTICAAGMAALKDLILESGLSVSDLVFTAWASASTYRDSDKRGGANGARIRLEPQRNWDVNQPEALSSVLNTLEQIRETFNESRGDDTEVSLADVIVLGGCVAVEKASADAGYEIEVPFRQGRTDATQEWTDEEWFAALEPKSDAFRNYEGKGNRWAPEALLLERANQLTLTAPEMTVLLGGLRVLGANYGHSPLGVFTERPGTLTNDFFVNLTDPDMVWGASTTDAAVYEGRHCVTGELSWTGTRIDMVFESASQLRCLAERYASNDARETFAADFVRVWDKVMNLDMFGR
ncbi:catalase-peroxidase 3 [Rhodococcoides trifolii]|uniref:Catalase-peroxidase n=1 Tax=Rhodococcoides trifolii TaxID=908250 RepID=A0A917CV00_9NOCA|nr:catalase/peroxidase HPI [Rhodococcus trifolii]GGF99845.1 catalase-peroxidase 3 [Rhodococcus trifolii]